MKKITSFKELPPEKLAWRLDPDKIPFASSEECKSCEGIIGQNRAIRSIQTGLDVKSLGYNIFITGLVGTGRTTTIKQLLEKLEKEDKTPDDILFVNNFKVPDEPTLITLPSLFLAKTPQPAGHSLQVVAYQAALPVTMSVGD